MIRLLVLAASLLHARPVSSCANNVGDSGFTGNFFETSIFGAASEISNIVPFSTDQFTSPSPILGLWRSLGLVDPRERLAAPPQLFGIPIRPLGEIPSIAWTCSIVMSLAASTRRLIRRLG